MHQTVGLPTLQNLPSSERHIPSNPQRRVGEVGTTAGHHSTTRNFVWITCKSLNFLLLCGRRPAVIGMLCASRGLWFRANYKGLARRHTKDLLFNFMWKVNKLHVHKTSLWLCMGCERLCMGCERLCTDCPSPPQDSLRMISQFIVYAIMCLKGVVQLTWGHVHGVRMYLIGPVASNWSRCLFRTGYQFVMEILC